MRIAKYFLASVIAILTIGCINPLGDKKADSNYHPGLTGTAPIVSTVDVTNNILTLGGSNLDSVNSVQIAGIGSFSITSQTGSILTAVPVSSTTLALSTAYSLLLASSVAQASTTITFTLPNPLILPVDGLNVGAGELITTGGNVGIGTTSPGYALQVSSTNANATIAARNPSASSWSQFVALNDINDPHRSATFGYSGSSTTSVLTGDSLGEQGFQGTVGNYPFVFYTNNTARMTVAAGGNVGVGTTSPGLKLEVSTGDQNGLALRSSGTSILRSYPAGGGAFVIDNASNSGIYFQNAEATQMTIQSSGNVGIGVVNPVTPLQLASGAFVSGAGVWTNASDRSRKKNIEPLTYGLKEVLEMRPVSFDYKVNDSHGIGFIAQDMEKIIPESVSGMEGNKGIGYGLLTAVLTNAIKEQQQEIEQLKKLICLDHPQASVCK